MTALWGPIWIAVVIATVRLGWWLYGRALQWKPRAVYHVHDDEGHVIYVGSANHIRSRMVRHRRDQNTKSRWYALASARFQLTLEPDFVHWYPTQESAFEAEDLAVRTLKPIGNKINVRRERMEG